MKVPCLNAADAQSDSATQNSKSSDPRASETGVTPIRVRPIRVLRLAQVLEMTGLGKTTIYELQSAGKFPRSVKITAHSVGWMEDEVQSWLEERMALRTGPPGEAETSNASPRVCRVRSTTPNAEQSSAAINPGGVAAPSLVCVKCRATRPAAVRLPGGSRAHLSRVRSSRQAGRAKARSSSY